MNAAGSRSRETASQLSGVLGVAACHEGSRFLMANLDEADLVLALAKGFHDAVDAVPRHPENGTHAPGGHGVDQYVGYSSHGEVPLRRLDRPPGVSGMGRNIGTCDTISYRRGTRVHI